MFDSVMASCPNCGSSLEYQSKAGDCLLRTYCLDEVPVGIAISVDGDQTYCEGCETSYRIVLDEEQPKTVKMRLEQP